MAKTKSLTSILGETIAPIKTLSYITSINTFGNYNHFGGFPFVPTGNPFVMKIVQPTGTGKK